VPQHTEHDIPNTEGAVETEPLTVENMDAETAMTDDKPNDQNDRPLLVKEHEQDVAGQERDAAVADTHMQPNVTTEQSRNRTTPLAEEAMANDLGRDTVTIKKMKLEKGSAVQPERRRSRTRAPQLKKDKV
jgi:hypothetical protein